MTHDTIDLRDLVDSLIDARDGDEHIDPAAIAAEAAAQLGESELRRVYIRQLARAACRKRFGRGGDDDGDGPDPQGEMFPAESFEASSAAILRHDPRAERPVMFCATRCRASTSNSTWRLCAARPAPSPHMPMCWNDGG
jgi:hypothetical protein